jgi:hypothetical protein
LKPRQHCCARQRISLAEISSEFQHQHSPLTAFPTRHTFESVRLASNQRYKLMQRLPKANLRWIFKSAVDFQETDEYCNAHAHPVFLAGRDRMADLQIVHSRVSLPAKKNRMCTKKRLLLNAEFGTEVWGGVDEITLPRHGN